VYPNGYLIRIILLISDIRIFPLRTLREKIGWKNRSQRQELRIKEQYKRTEILPFPKARSE
jgi:hypothetical protein